MAGMATSSKTGSLYFAMSIISSSRVGDEVVSGEKTLWMKSTALGPTRTARVLPIMRAIFLGARAADILSVVLM